jgi:hypothetical protein
MARERADRLFKKAHSINRLTTSSEFLRCSLLPPSTGVSQLRDFLDVRDRSVRPACLGAEPGKFKA